MSEEPAEDADASAAAQDDPGAEEALQWLRALGDDLATAMTPPDVVEERLSQVTGDSAQQPRQRPDPAPRQLSELAVDMLAEAEYLLNQQLMAEAHPSRHAALTDVRATLDRARDLANDRPSTAIALAVSAVQTLETLSRLRTAVDG